MNDPKREREMIWNPLLVDAEIRSASTRRNDMDERV